MAALSACTSWALDSIKTAFMTLALTSLSCKEKRQRNFREASQEVQLLRMASREATQTSTEAEDGQAHVDVEPRLAEKLACTRSAVACDTALPAHLPGCPDDMPPARKFPARGLEHRSSCLQQSSAV